MTDPLEAAAEALRSIPSLQMKSLEQRREIARVVLEAAGWGGATASLLDLAQEHVAELLDSFCPKDGDGKPIREAMSAHGGEALEVAKWEEAIARARATRPTSIADLGSEIDPRGLPVYKAMP